MDDFFLIHSLKHQTGANVVWWGRDRCGYVTDLRLAGRYRLEEAREIVGDGSRSRAYRERDVVRWVHQVVDVGNLNPDLAVPL